jgi:tetratricopeptide (TPR) repeat protein
VSDERGDDGFDGLDDLGHHLDLETVRRLGGAELPRLEVFDIAWHLYLCPECRELLAEAGPEAREAYRRLFGEGGMGFPLTAYTRPVGEAARSMRRIGFEVRAERAGAHQLVSRLLRHAPERRRLLVRQRERYRTYSVADALVEVCRASMSDDPSGAEALAELALWILESLDRARYPEDMVNDLRAQAWAAIANCRRIGCDLVSVSRAFELAEGFLRRGTGDPVDAAGFLDLQVSYLIDLHRFLEADDALRRLLRIYREAGDRHSEGRVLLKQAALRREQGRLDEAIVLLEQAEATVDLSREPRLELSLRRDLALYLAEAGRAEEAQALLPGLRALARERGNRPESLRLLRAEGVIYHRLGHLELAVEALDQARVGFLELGFGYDAAFATLDLALAHADAGRPESVRALGGAMRRLFESRELHRDTRAALGILDRALESRRVDRALYDEIASHLRRARRDAGLGLEAGLDAGS